MEMSLGSENGARSWGGDVGGLGWEVLSYGEAETPGAQGEWGATKGGRSSRGLAGDFVL